MIRNTFSSCLIVAIASLSLACSSDDDGGGNSGSASSPAAAWPKLTELEDGWNEIRPGGDTICSRGTEYAFFVHPGSTDKVVIDFIGGGACWNKVTCSIAGSIFSEDVEQVRAVVAANVPIGIYDRTRDDNPFKDWTHVIVPYCTGDVHWGNAATEYDEGDRAFTIEHKGAVNSRAALEWVYYNLKAPERVFVTGCSAGSYGSAMWSAHVMNHYSNAKVYQFGDSGAGIITDTFFRDSFPNWNAEGAFPGWIPELDPATQDLLDKQLPDLYAGIANYYPQHVLSQYNTTYDENQLFYYEAMGGGGGRDQWSSRMQSSVGEINQRAENFYSFRAPGEQHCIIVANNFYTVEANGTKLVTWLDDMVNDRPISDVDCSDCDRETP